MAGSDDARFVESRSGFIDSKLEKARSEAPGESFEGGFAGLAGLFA